MFWEGNKRTQFWSNALQRRHTASSLPVCSTCLKYSFQYLATTLKWSGKFPYMLFKVSRWLGESNSRCSKVRFSQGEYCKPRWLIHLSYSLMIFQKWTHDWCTHDEIHKKQIEKKTSLTLSCALLKEDIISKPLRAVTVEWKWCI